MISKLHDVVGGRRPGLGRHGALVALIASGMAWGTSVPFSKQARGWLPNNTWLQSQLPANVNGVYEIVIDGVDEAAVGKAMAAGIKAACHIPGVVKISAGNYGGKLGQFHYRLLEHLP